MTAGITLTDTANGTTAEHELAALQREHGRPLFALLLRLSDGDRQRAEDLVQETLVRAWQHPEALRADDFDSVRPWLLTVARRLAIDARRARQARPRRSATPCSRTRASARITPNGPPPPSMCGRL